MKWKQGQIDYWVRPAMEGGQPNSRSKRSLAIDETQPADAGQRLPS